MEINQDASHNTEHKKTTRKISFKCRKSSLYHHTVSSPAANTNMVAYLTSKFNAIDKDSQPQHAELNRLIKRINSYKATQIQVDKLKRATRKPSVKMKPILKTERAAQVEHHFITGNVRAAIQNFEKRSLETSPNDKCVPKARLPLKEQSNMLNAQNAPNQAQIKTEKVQIPICCVDSRPSTPAVPNSSFLWRKRSQELLIASVVESYEVVGNSVPVLIKSEDHSYEYCHSPPKYEDLESSKQEDIYETIPYLSRNSLPFIANKQQEPLPARPISWIGHSSQSNDGVYESIYNMGKVTAPSDNYESIYDYHNNWDIVSNQDSLISDQKSNSLYERASSVCSTINNEQTFSDVSDKSDEWIDVSDGEEPDQVMSSFVVVRSRHRNRPTGWTKKIRNQWNKTQLERGETDPDHHYETLQAAQTDHKDVEYSDDSFESDSETKNSLEIDINNLQLPEPPSHGLTKLAVSAGKHMKRLRKNWSLTKNDITKSFKRIRKRTSTTTLDTSIEKQSEENQSIEAINSSEPLKQFEQVAHELRSLQSDLEISEVDLTEKRRSDGFLNKFRRSISVSGNDISHTIGNRPKSTFYLTETVDIDKAEDLEVVTPVVRRHTKAVRPQSPPPPIPSDTNQINSSKSNKENKRSTSWYAEVGLFKNSENISTQRPNTSWYAEIGLYHNSTGSTPNTSSTENSGNTTNSFSSPKFESNEDYYNLKNDTDSSNNSMSTIENCYSNQLRLQDEPLYQFYDAAVFDENIDDFDSDGYEEVLQNHLSNRPSAMELICPSRNGTSINRTLWCEIPEVLQSTVLSTLSIHQKKLQEAKFEMITSEASYLNSLNVLWDHFIANLSDSNLLTSDEKYTLFGKVKAVKRCSKSLLSDMEKCWQDNILLNGICDIIKKHVDNNFTVYVPYCENQILLDSTLRKIRDRSSCNDFLRNLESGIVCQSLTLYSFLLLPMQRITRWPLLIDAVLKRLSPEDNEYVTCQYILGALNKIVADCNEAARNKERETEIKKISEQIEFPKNISIINLVSTTRWLIRSGPLVHMQARADDIRLTFGKRFSKMPINLFLFNDLLIICKPKNDGNFLVIHYCFRSYIDLNAGDLIQSLPGKESQGRHLLFLTLLENHEGKMVEMLLACSSESDKERWIEALSAPKSDDPDEILYDCWDCPQVTAVHAYSASQPDELALNRGDVVNVNRKMADGWFHGERLRDGQIGWFPGNYTVEIANPHVRARNLKQRYRFLALSQNYLKAK